MEVRGATFLGKFLASKYINFFAQTPLVTVTVRTRVK